MAYVTSGYETLAKYYGEDLTPIVCVSQELAQAQSQVGTLLILVIVLVFVLVFVLVLVLILAQAIHK